MADATNARKNWIITDHGDAINLDFVTKILWGGTFLPTPQPLNVYIYHGIQEGKGATIKYTYATSDEAEDAYNEMIETMVGLGIVSDLRPVPAPALVAITPTSASHTGGDILTITGTNFEIFGADITIDGVDCAIISVSADEIKLYAPVHAIGSGYDVVYSDGTNTSTLSAVFSFT